MKTIIKNKILQDLADLVVGHADEIKAANNLDLQACSQEDAALYDRLKVDNKKIRGMQASILKVMQMEDPEGKVLYQYQKQPNLIVENRVVPFGTILIIYESRPDVTIEAAITAFKAGNKILLKGGKEARNSNLILANLWQQALSQNNQDENFVQYLDYDREQTQNLIKSNEHKIDIIIPRGGEKLIQSIQQNTNIPMIISGRGNNFMYIDSDADFNMATEIILDGKSRISVCNALDKVYINQDTDGFENKVTQLIQVLTDNHTEIVADKTIKQLSPHINAIESQSVFYQEFLANKLLLATVEDLQQAIEGINKYSGGHSAVIISNNSENVQKFQKSVDCAAVYHNASTRYTDGGEFGLGAEIAISTQKLHFRGPVGLNELVTNKWFITGQGHTRG